MRDYKLTALRPCECHDSLAPGACASCQRLAALALRLAPGLGAVELDELEALIDEKAAAQAPAQAQASSSTAAAATIEATLELDGQAVELDDKGGAKSSAQALDATVAATIASPTLDDAARHGRPGRPGRAR